MNARGEVTIAMVALVAVAASALVAFLGGGFHDRSAMTIIKVTNSTNIVIRIEQRLNPSGGADIDIPLKQTEKKGQP